MQGAAYCVGNPDTGIFSPGATEVLSYLVMLLSLGNRYRLRAIARHSNLDSNQEKQNKIKTTYVQ